MTRTFFSLLAIGMTAGASLATAAEPTTPPAATERATTQPAPVLTLHDCDRLLARRLRDAGEQYKNAVQTALQERVQQLHALMDRAIAARRLDDANQIQAAVTSAEAELQARRRHAPVTLHITGTIDGRGVLVLRPDRAVWQQIQYAPPTDLTINGVRWNPTASPTLENAGRTTFLPPQTNLGGATLVKKSGRNLVELVTSSDALRISFDDTDPGAGKYDLTIDLTPQSMMPLPGMAEAKD